MNDLDEVVRKREQQQNQDAVKTSAYERLKAQGALDEQQKLDDQKRTDQQRLDDQRRADDRRADDLRQDEDRKADFYKRYEAEKEKLADREDCNPTAKMVNAATKLAEKDNLKGPNTNSFNDTRAWLNAHHGIEDIHQQRRAKSQASESSSGQDRDDKGSADRLTSRRSNSRDLEMESPAAQGPGDFVDIYGNPVSRAQLEGALANYQAQAARGNLPSSVQKLANGQGIGVKPEPRGWVPEIGNELPDSTDAGTPDTTGAIDAMSDTAGIDKQGLQVASQAVDNVLDIGVDAAPQKDSQADFSVGQDEETRTTTAELEAKDEVAEAVAEEAVVTEVLQDEAEVDFEPPEDWPEDNDWAERRIDAALAAQEEESDRLIAEELKAQSAAPEIQSLSEAQLATQEVLNDYQERAAQGEVMEDRTVQVNLGQEPVSIDELQDDQPVTEEVAELETDAPGLSPAQLATQEVLNDYRERAERGEEMEDRTVTVNLGQHTSQEEAFELPPDLIPSSVSGNVDYETELEKVKPDHIKERELQARNSGQSSHEGTDYETELTNLRKRMQERKEKEKSQGNERG